MTPLESTDICFSLQVDHLNLAKYTEMIANTDLIRDDLDKIIIKYNPKRSHIRFEMPQFELTDFDPIKYNLNEYSYVTSNARLVVEVPDHLAIIAVLVNNNTKTPSETIKFKSFVSIKNALRKKNDSDE